MEEEKGIFMVEQARKKQIVQGRLGELAPVSTNILFYIENWPSLCLNLFGLKLKSVTWVYTADVISNKLAAFFPPKLKWV
jgi:hypothetical protein